MAFTKIASSEEVIEGTVPNKKENNNNDDTDQSSTDQEYFPPDSIVASSESSQCSSTSWSSSSSDLDLDDEETNSTSSSFLTFRLSYILVNLVIMLADGLQGTHLYVLYDGYGFSVASLYCLGFLTGAVTSPITGPLIDKFGRKKSALLYCILEIGINMLEQYPFLLGLVVSRMVGGITTNLLSSVFDTWVDTEYRKRGFDKSEYEIVMRDAVIVKNLAAIASGYLAHILAEHSGPVGPFRGAVTCTVIALVVVFVVWTENYGGNGGEGLPSKSLQELMNDAVTTFKSDTRVLRVGIIQGMTMASLMIFVFLWSPTLAAFGKVTPPGTTALDGNGEPAYGLIFGAFMAAGVLGGLLSPYFRRTMARLVAPLEARSSKPLSTPTVVETEDRPLANEFAAALCYFVSAMLLMVPCMMSESDPLSFTISLGAFLLYEFLIGLYMPCEGVIRSLYIPSDARGSMMMLPHIVVNVLVALGVVATEFVSLRTAFGIVACLMTSAAFLQVSLVSKREWEGLSGRLDQFQRQTLRPARALSCSAVGAISKMGSSLHRASSMPITGCGKSSSRLSASSNFLHQAMAEVQAWANHLEDMDDRDTSKLKAE